MQLRNQVLALVLMLQPLAITAMEQKQPDDYSFYKKLTEERLTQGLTGDALIAPAEIHDTVNLPGRLIYKNFLDLLRLLLDKHKIDPNHPMGHWPNTLASIAVTNNNLEALKLVVSFGAVVTKPSGLNSYTPLHAAVGGIYKKEHEPALETVRFLLEHKADLNAQTSFGYTPLMQLAALRDTYTISLETQKDIARILIEAGTRVNIKSQDLQKNAYQLAVTEKKPSLADVILNVATSMGQVLTAAEQYVSLQEIEGTKAKMPDIDYMYY